MVKGNLGVGVFDQVLADAVNVLDDDRVGDEVGGFFDFHRILLANADFPVGGVPVAQAAAADVASADGGDVVLAAGLDVRVEGFAGRRDGVGLGLGVGGGLLLVSRSGAGVGLGQRRGGAGGVLGGGSGRCGGGAGRGDNLAERGDGEKGGGEAETGERAHGDCS